MKKEKPHLIDWIAHIMNFFGFFAICCIIAIALSTSEDHHKFAKEQCAKLASPEEKKSFDAKYEGSVYSGQWTCYAQRCNALACEDLYSFGMVYV